MTLQRLNYYAQSSVVAPRLGVLIAAHIVQVSQGSLHGAEGAHVWGLDLQSTESLRENASMSKILRAVPSP
jgi:hypothetical protein